VCTRSGSALNLALAVLFAELRKRALAYTESRILFAFWGAEELGLLGSRHYVSQLGTGNNPSVSDLALNLNYDMVASPNFIRGIYNGSGAVSGPLGFCVDLYCSVHKCHLCFGKMPHCMRLADFIAL
jgi:Zn-dependent M28 family amino/carboxypeptidase